MIIDSYLKLLQEKIEASENYNIDEFFSRLNKVIKKNENYIKTENLGYAREFPIIFIKPKKISDKPKVLIAAGFHGDESSGPWAVLNFLESNKYPTRVNVSFLPLVNPTGFNLSRRFDFWGKEPNNGYIKTQKFSKPSHEDEILKKHLDLLSKYGKDCLVTLHEDDQEHFYIYTYGDKDKLDAKLLSMGEEKFGLIPSRLLKLAEAFESPEDGIRKDDKDGSFEYEMILKGTKKSITAENPSRKPFKERVELYIEIIKEVCKSKYY